MKKISNIKLTNGIHFLNLAALLSIFIVGFFGLRGVTIVNDNMTSMYKNQLIPITELANIRSNYLRIRIQVSNANNNYTSEVNDKIKNYQSIVDAKLESYKKSLDSYEKKEVDKFEEAYSNYMNLWEKLSTKSSNGEKFSEEDLAQLNDFGSKAEDALAALLADEEKDAEKVNSEGDAIFIATRANLFYLGVALMVMSLAIGAVIVTIIKKSSKDMINKLEVLSKGDFTVEIETDQKNEFGIMKKSLAETVNNISNMLKLIKDESHIIENHSEGLSAISEEMASSSENVAAAIQDVAKGTSVQAGDLVSISGIINDFGEQLNKMVLSIKDIDNNSKEVGIMTNESNGNMQITINSITKISGLFKEFTNKISGLGENINKVNEITNLINSIAEQTNLLALNAAIEAARAGEAGRGFSVVAEEIRKLAEQSKTSSEDINLLISSISQEAGIIVNDSVVVNSELEKQLTNIGSVIHSFRKIIEAVEDVTPKIEEVSSSAVGLEKNKNEISTQIENASSIAEEISASSEEIAASSEEMSSSSQEVAHTAQKLSELTKDMMEQVNKFKL
ncbi:methyl-accepting chemotaxis protein [Clostridium sp. A1-XYC3]|uniref:Methyl-accepting chemotaxis protein n=1 Tax=Clostridium tanneri TaxID=3037988 RepID=A0ABU4JW24_9CLOT|nr:methyl-accepting chemotaxis protein [Clostridium sp. A1-XYC3]MDW8802146.1 methyl-accepting chemotaxis protein [Clostridium sp. A1-XYC3]